METKSLFGLFKSE